MNFVLFFIYESPLLALFIGAALAYAEYQLIHRGLLIDVVMGLTESYIIHLTLSE